MRSDPSLLALGRILRMVDQLAAPERAYLIARLQQPAPVLPPPDPAPVVEPVTAPTAARAVLAPDQVTTAVEEQAKGFMLIDEVEQTITRVGGHR